MRRATFLMTGILVLLAIASIGATLPSHSAAILAQASIQPQRAIVEQTTGPDNWPTYHRDNSRSGYDPEIPPFTSAALHWTTQLDGAVYAEPLIVGGDVIVATEQNSLYELDAATGDILWHQNLGTPVTSGLYCSGDITPSGITSTPVIDTVSGTIFVVAFLQGPPLHHQLFAIDLSTGAVEFNVGVDPSSPNFPVNAQQQRAAVTLANGYVYIPYGGLDGDCGPYHGWVAAIAENGQGSLLSYQVPTGRAGAIWGGGDGPAVDQSGNLLVATGNSDATSTFDYGDAVLKISSATASPPLSLLDYFAPSNWAALNSGDVDLGSTDPVVLSSNYLFQIGKEGVGYILSANSLGGIGGQVYTADVCNGGGAYGGLAYSSPYLIVPCDNGLVALSITLGSSPSFTTAWQGPNFQTGPPIIAGNAVWDVDTSNNVLYAFSLTTGQEIFSDPNIGSVPTHFNSVSAGDGQIFVTANDYVRAYTPQSVSLVTALSSTTAIESTTTTTSTSTSSDSTSVSTIGNTVSRAQTSTTLSTTTFTSGSIAGTRTSTFTSSLTSYSTTTTLSSSSQAITQTGVTTVSTLLSSTTTSTDTMLSTAIASGTTTVSQTDTFNMLVTTIIQELHQFSNELVHFLGFQVTATPVSRQVHQVVVTTTSQAKSLSVALISPANGAEVTAGSTLTLKVTVTSSGKGVSAKVTIKVNGTTVCTPTSNASGSASCSFKVSTKTGVNYSWFATASKTGYSPGTSSTWTFHT